MARESRKIVKDLLLDEEIITDIDLTGIEGTVTVDNKLDINSTNPVQNKVITKDILNLKDTALLKPNGGSISGDTEIYKANFNILSGNYIQTTDPKNTVFTKNSFL